MTGRNLIKLGFKRVNVGKTRSDPFYYVYNIGDNCSLISNLNSGDTDWFVELYDIVDGVRFVNARELKTLIDVLERNLIVDDGFE